MFAAAAALLQTSGKEFQDMVPARISIVTYNIWLTERWPARAPALERFLTLFSPDVLCVQELQRTTQEFLDGVLKGHDRVHDALPGWTNEGNIYWNKGMFEGIEHGAEAVGHVEPERRLFWVRLRLRDSRKTIFVSTAHLTAPRKSDEPETGLSPRVGQLKRISDALARLPQAQEPAFFMGDMNDAWHPQRILKRVGFIGSFAALGLQSPPTFQCYPTAGVEPAEPTITEAIDIIVANQHARAVASSVPQCYCGDMAPSDHWPVQAIYQLA
ncbi:MAG TPA: endonuclease/exonuclease/phosphatase family protein [Burkholderiales bacterium]|nr:endonuclease/exonuclease/phosphatase family protein [Burkholderiales bacterium]